MSRPTTPKPLVLDGVVLLDLLSVATRLGKHVETINRYRRDPWAEFPKPRRIGRTPYWAEAEIAAWVEGRR